MKSIIETWKDGLSYLLTDDEISYYVYFSFLLSGVAYSWIKFSTMEAIFFTVIFSCYILNVVMFSFFKGIWEGEKQEELFSNLYIICYVIIFIIGCKINILYNMSIALSSTFLTKIWLVIRELQDPNFKPSNDKKKYIKIFLRFILQLEVVLVPYLTFTICFVLIPNLSIVFKVIVPFIYFLIVPFILYYEDASSACNVFELAYDITYWQPYGNNKSSLRQKTHDKIINKYMEHIKKKRDKRIARNNNKK